MKKNIPLRELGQHANSSTIKMIRHLLSKYDFIYNTVLNEVFASEKEKDEFIEFRDIKNITTSIRTGRTMKEIEINIKKSTKGTILGIEISNPEKLLYNKPKITKKEVIKYYEAVAKRMLPFLKNRIISTVRCPEGINGDSFFKKHFENEREGFNKIEVKNKDKKQEDYYYITND